MSYEIDADALFSDSDGGSPHGGSSLPTVAPPKRPRRALAPPQCAPSLGTIRLTLPPGSSLSSNTHSVASNQSSMYGSHSAPAPQPSSSYQNPSTTSYAPTDRRPYRPRHDGSSSHPPFGRGRGATLPAHITRGPIGPRDCRGQKRRFSNDMSRGSHRQHPGALTPEAFLPTSTTVDEQLLKSAASILPAGEREKVLNESKTHSGEQRKRPGVSRKRNEARSLRSSATEEREKAVIRRNVQRAQSSASKFQGLDTLLKSTQKAVGEGLIRLDRSSSSKGKSQTSTKPRRLSERDIYAGVTMSKEMREREENERREEKRRFEEERLAIIEHYRTLRENERMERERLRNEWRKVETVAAGARQSHRLERVERTLTQDDDDHFKGDPLSCLGLILKPVQEDDLSTQLMTVEVVEI